MCFLHAAQRTSCLLFAPCLFLIIITLLCVIINNYSLANTKDKGGLQKVELSIEYIRGLLAPSYQSNNNYPLASTSGFNLPFFNY